VRMRFFVNVNNLIGSINDTDLSMSSAHSSQDSFAFGLYEQPDQFEWTQRDGAEVDEVML
jgi:hypothetical protein